MWLCKGKMLRPDKTWLIHSSYLTPSFLVGVRIVGTWGQRHPVRLALAALRRASALSASMSHSWPPDGDLPMFGVPQPALMNGNRGESP